MSKSYYSFEKRGTFGEITGQAGSLFSNDDKLFISAGTNTLNKFSIRKSSLVSNFQVSSPISCIALHQFTALGFRDGQVSVYTEDNAIRNTFEGHESTISALVFDAEGLILYSGSYDTSIIIWDLVADCAVKQLFGHRDAITSLLVSGSSLFSSSRDKTIKEWDQEMCVNTYLCPGEVWGVQKYENRLYGISEKFIRVWEGTTELGIIERGDNKRCKKFIARNGLFVLASSDKIEIWRLRGEKECEKKLKRRRKRNRDNDYELQFPDQYEKIVSSKIEGKIAGICLSNKLHKSKTHEHQLLVGVSFSSNTISLYILDYNLLKNLKTSPTFVLSSLISKDGHRSAARTLSLSDDNSRLLSGSGESLKIWDIKTQKCINTFESGYCVCSCWYPGDKFIMSGYRNGTIQIFDVLAGEPVVNEMGHEGAVWACQLFRQVLITGGADCTLKFWAFNISALQLKLLDSLALKDEILALKQSPCGKFICAALLDSTIQVLYFDSHKLLFSLYGHKLPVTAFDISYDSMLLVSGSSDKNIKIWGMDFGDCHKSIIAHTQPITDVKFVNETHFCFTAGRDFVIKYWDIDSREVIQVLKGHSSEIWSICISTQGDFLISSSNDLSFFIWAQTNTQLFLQEQKELEIESKAKLEDFGLQKPKKESALLTHASAEVLKSGESLIEALEVCIQYKEHLALGEVALPPPHFAGKDEFAYILKQLQMIPPQYVDSILHILPYNYSIELFRFLEKYLTDGIEIELVAKIVILLIKVHESSLVSSIFGNEHWLLALDRVKDKLKQRTKEHRDLIGKNIAAARYILKEIS